MNKLRLLIIEDEAHIRDMVRFALERADFTIDEAQDAQEARQSIANYLPDLILLDWMLPNQSGLDLLRQFKKNEQTRDVPVIMLTARTDETDTIKGLNSGADDYITKPFSPKELIARIKAVIRRTLPRMSEQIITIDGLCIDQDTHRVSYNDSLIELGPTEYRFLLFFMTHNERVYSRGQLLDQIWGNNVYLDERTVDVHIGRLRKILGSHGLSWMLQTVRGSGYRFSNRK